MASLTLAIALGGGITGVGSLWWASAGTHDAAPRPSAAVQEDPTRSGPERPDSRTPLADDGGAPAAPAKAAPLPAEVAAIPGLEPVPRTAAEHTTRNHERSTARTDRGRAGRLEAKALRLINAERAEAGCGPLEEDASLHRAALGHSNDMAEGGYFAHTSPEGGSPWERAKSAGYAKPASENIARGYDSATVVIEAWMESSGHRKNILDCDSHAVGIGVHVGGAGGPYWTQVFGYQ